MAFEVIQHVLAFLSGLEGTGATLDVPITQVPGTQLVVATTPGMDEASGKKAILHPVLSPVMTGTKHELLTKFLKLKPPFFHDIKSENVYEFILYCSERLRKLGIVFINMRWSLLPSIRVMPSNGGGLM
ncbi:hypothetical protein MTR67_038917 [Solanum verrucosum]|uniref:Uncharacterized protein n=1 Tax=Solanum verrucosum TaxID=315347 RepID=A0AAF0UGB4_SOLVR|nr:hypothetical protein MTR67_038917 [Solanum verrucosum]